MKTRFVVAVLGTGLLLAPVVLSVGALVVLPLVLILLPVLLLLGIAALPALLMAAVRAPESAGTRSVETAAPDGMPAAMAS